MTNMIRAIYENGVFRPLDVPNLPEHQQVRLIVESIPTSARDDDQTETPDPLANVRVATGIPDLAEHFDDYRFGRRQP